MVETGIAVAALDVACVAVENAVLVGSSVLVRPSGIAVAEGTGERGNTVDGSRVTMPGLALTDKPGCGVGVIGIGVDEPLLSQAVSASIVSISPPSSKRRRPFINSASPHLIVIAIE